MKLKNPLNPSLSVVSNTQHLEIDSRIDSDSSVKFLDAVLPRRFQIATTKNTQYSLFYLRYIYRRALIAICTLERDENRVPSIHEHDILGFWQSAYIGYAKRSMPERWQLKIEETERERDRSVQASCRSMESGMGGDFLFGIAHWTLDIFGIRLSWRCFRKLARPVQWKVYQSLNIRGYGLKYGRAAVCLSEDFPTAMCSWHGASSKLLA